MNSMVCVVDGDPAVRDSLATLMDLNGHHVRTFSTGGAFLRAFGNEATHFVVCEAELPDTTGFEIFLALQALPANPHFALLVSNSNPGNLEIARQHGIKHVFAKPLVHRRLISFIATPLET